MKNILKWNDFFLNYKFAESIPFSDFMSTCSLMFYILFPLPFSKTLFLQVSLFILYWQFFSIWSLSSAYKLIFPILKKTL